MRSMLIERFNTNLKKKKNSKLSPPEDFFSFITDLRDFLNFAVENVMQSL